MIKLVVGTLGFDYVVILETDGQFVVHIMSCLYCMERTKRLMFFFMMSSSYWGGGDSLEDRVLMCYLEVEIVA